jgi:catechol 2,3-dioxygenase
MKTAVRGVRSVEIEMSDPARAAEFYGKTWNLTEVARSNGSYWFRGTGTYHHILAIHPATQGVAIRRLTFAPPPDTGGAMPLRAAAPPVLHAGAGPGGGYGLICGCQGRNLAVRENEHSDTPT